MLFRELFSHVSPYLDTYVLRLIDLNRCFFAMHNGMPLFGYVLRLIDLNRFFFAMQNRNQSCAFHHSYEFSFTDSCKKPEAN